ncbi:MAG: SRPBCC family protein [Pyrinomonadaceae bacterium]
MIKKILIALAVFLVVVVGAIAALIMFVPTNYAVERETVVNKPIGDVFAYVKILKNQNEWGPWVKRDPKIKLTSEGTDGTVGYISRWDSEDVNVGAGEQEITKIEEGKRIDYKLRFKKPFESESDSYVTTEAVGADKTKVKWGFTGEMPRPMNLMLLFVDMDAEVGKDFDAGLSNLKSIVEKGG